jgi:hypothetical protein
VTTIKPKRSPESDLPGRYLVTGLLGFMLLAIGVPSLARAYQRRPQGLRSYPHGRLGWITMTMFGALYQLFPVAVGGTVRSPRLGRWNYWVLATGIPSGGLPQGADPSPPRSACCVIDRPAAVAREKIEDDGDTAGGSGGWSR